MAQAATLRRYFPTMWRLLTAPFRWIGRSRWRIWGAALVLTALIVGPPIWWATELVGLPDVGDPFDVAAFRAFTIPDERNAFVLYRQAAAQLKPLGRFQNSSRNSVDWFASWSKADPELRRWADDNREALALYRQGAERPDALGQIPKFQGDHYEISGMYGPFNSLFMLALLEGSRLEEQGDMAGAWDWYRTVLRSCHLVGRHGSVRSRRVAQHWHNILLDRLTSWAADPRTTTALLHKALDDVLACEALSPSESYTLKAEYLDVDRILDDPEGPLRQLAGPKVLTIRFGDIGLTPEQLRQVNDARWFLFHEPERSRRVIRLAMANWLAYFDTPPECRPKPDPRASQRFDFYPPGPGAPAAARALSPVALARWLDSSIDADYLLGSWGWNAVRSQERSGHRALVILLAKHLYCRERGTEPPTPEVLVGTYLKSLPTDDLDTKHDETIPIVGDATKAEGKPTSW
jgi:hypothetical protein